MKITENGPDLKSKPEKRQCEGEVFNRYSNGGAGGHEQCRKPAEPGSNVCRFHREDSV